MKLNSEVKIQYLKKREKRCDNSHGDSIITSLLIEDQSVLSHVAKDEPEGLDIQNRKITVKKITDGLLALINEANLSEDSRDVLNQLYMRYQSELTNLRKTYPHINEQTKPKNQKIQRKNKAKRRKAQQRKASEFIEKNHKLSGYHRINPRPLQGGSPGLGKKS